MQYIERTKKSFLLSKFFFTTKNAIFTKHKPVSYRPRQKNWENNLMKTELSFFFKFKKQYF